MILTIKGLTGCRRHLVRLWLRDPEYAWQTPQQLQSRWDDLYHGVTPEKQVFPLEPRIRSASSGARKNWTPNGATSG
jgi:hypothetical protein